MAHGWVRATNNTKNGEDRECIVFFLHGPQEQGPEANEDGSWWSAKESQSIKVPTARFPIFRLLENNCVQEKKRGKKKRKGIVNAGEQGARVCLLQAEANAERRTRRPTRTHSLAPRPTSRSTVLCRPVAMTGYDPSLYTLKKSR